MRAMNPDFIVRRFILLDTIKTFRGMKALKAVQTTIFAMFLGIFVMVSCDKDDSIAVGNSEILGKWESTTFEVSQCTDVQDNVEMRTCDLSEFDDVECGVMEFRSDGKALEDGMSLEDASIYTIENDMLSFTHPKTDESITFRFEISANTLTLYKNDFNSPGCFLAVNLIRVN
jgi:hypothetical protein